MAIRPNLFVTVYRNTLYIIRAIHHSKTREESHDPCSNIYKPTDLDSLVLGGVQDVAHQEAQGGKFHVGSFQCKYGL